MCYRAIVSWGGFVRKAFVLVWGLIIREIDFSSTLVTGVLFIFKLLLPTNTINLTFCLVACGVFATVMFFPLYAGSSSSGHWLERHCWLKIPPAAASQLATTRSRVSVSHRASTEYRLVRPRTARGAVAKTERRIVRTDNMVMVGESCGLGDGSVWLLLFCYRGVLLLLCS